MTNSRAKRQWDLIITKKVNEPVTSSTTLQDDDELFSVLQPGTYIFQFDIIFDSAAAQDAKYTLTFSGTSDDNIGFKSHTIDTTTDVWGTSRSIVASVWPIAFQIFGIAVITAVGTLTFQFAQNTSDAAATIVNKGSRLLLRKVF